MHIMQKYKEHHDMMTQENLTGKKPGDDLTKLSSREKQIHYERIEDFTIRLRPLTSYCYLE